MAPELNNTSGIQVHFSETWLTGNPRLPASKSESNRALMLRAFSGNQVEIENLSEADDTQILQQLLSSEESILNAGHGGTTLRFIAPWLAFQNKKVILSGSARLNQRPVGPLVDALKKLGATIDYIENEGFPPIQISGFQYSGHLQIWINTSTSSQWLSALLMAAPTLPLGLEILLDADEPVSKSYIQMTLDLMEECGIACRWEQRRIVIPPQPFQKSKIKIENDWSSASYWLAMATLKAGSKLELAGLKPNSIQGDSGILPILKGFGLEYSFSESSLSVSQPNPPGPKSEPLVLDLSSMPDLTQTIISICVISGQAAHLSGLQNLQVKESNRLVAMQMELKKMGAIIDIDPNEGTCLIPADQNLHPPSSPFETHHDHRMAMALSLFALYFPITIKNPEVVTKSYPGYWDELKKLGFQISLPP